MAVEWTITIEGRNDFGDTCREEVRIDGNWDTSTVSTARTERTSNIQAKTAPPANRLTPEKLPVSPRFWMNSGRIRAFTSRNKDAQNSSVASIDAPVIHDFRIMETRGFRNHPKSRL
jgi:hypothetical protein